MSRRLIGPGLRLGLPKLMRKFARNKSAATAAEFAIVALPLLALIFAALQAAIVLMAEEELETAADQAGRLVMTGQVTSVSGQTGFLSQANFQKKVCSYLVALFNCNNLMVNMQTASSFANAGVSPPTLKTLQNNQWSYQTGSAGQVVVLQVMYEWPVVSSILGFNLATPTLPNNTRLLMATSVFQNEP